MKKINPFLLAAFLLCLLIFLVHLLVVGNAIYGDGRYYFAIAKSLSLDRDLDFTNDYAFLQITEDKQVTGLLANKYPPGASFLWMPSMFLTNLVVGNNGYSLPYQIAAGVTSIVIGLLGIYLLIKTLNLFFEEKISLFTGLFILFSTNLLFYTAFDVLNSHATSFFLSALLLYLLFSLKETKQKWFFCGAVCGFLMLTRTQDVILLILPLLLLFDSPQTVTRKFTALVLFICGVILLFFPQLLIWKTIYGSFFLSPYFNRIESFSFLKPQVWGVLFNPNTGLVFWTPFLVLGFFGLFKLCDKLKSVRNIFLITVFLQFYLIASWSSWDQGASFSTRMLISSLPILAFGFASLFKIYLQKYSFKSLVFLLGFSFLINFGLIILYLMTH